MTAGTGAELAGRITNAVHAGGACKHALCHALVHRMAAHQVRTKPVRAGRSVTLNIAYAIRNLICELLPALRTVRMWLHVPVAEL
jgi:hypothetical protein